MPIKTVSLTSPYDASAREIERRRAMAAALQQQGSEPIQAGSYNGIQAPISWTQGLAKVLQSYTGAKQMKDADDESRALGERYQSDLRDTVGKAQRAMIGSPASSETIVDEQAAGGEGQLAQVNAPAVPGSSARAAEAYMAHPATQGIGIQMAQQDAERQRREAMVRGLLGGESQQGNPMAAGGSSVMSPGGGQSPTGGIDPRVLALSLAGEKDLAGMLHDQGKPVAVTEGGALMGRDGRIINSRPKLGENVLPIYDASGQIVGVRPMPGAADAAASITGAQEGARAGFDLVTVPVPGGGTQLMPRSVAAQRLGGGAPQPQAQPQGPVNFPSAGPQAPQPQGPQAGGGMGFSRPGGAQFSEKLGAKMGDFYADILAADVEAPKTLAKYERLGGLLANVNTGKFKGTITDLKAAAKSIGMDVSLIGDDIAPAQAATALSNQLALELRSPAGGAGMPGAMSDQDRAFLTRMVPNLENDPGAIPLMVEYRKKLAQRDQQVAKLARQYRKRNGSIDDGFFDELADWSAKNHMFPKQPATPGKPSNGFRVLSDDE